MNNFIRKVFHLSHTKSHTHALVTWGGFLLFTGWFTFNTLRFALETPYVDMIPILYKLIHPHSYWELFFYQHGNHYQGIGYVITSMMTSLFGLSIPMLSLLAIAVHVGTTFMVIFLIKQLFKQTHWTDVVIPLVMLSNRYYELFTVIPNISSAVLPLFFVVFISYQLTLRNKSDYLLIAVLGILTMYSGYGMLALPFILYILTIRANPLKHKIAPIITLFLFAIISCILIYNYNPNLGLTCYQHSTPDIGTILVFINNLILGFIGLGAYPNLILSPIVYVIVIACAYHVMRSAKTQDNQQTYHLIQLLLYGYAATFIIASAIGRQCLGVNASHASRYYFFVLPAFIAAYIDLRTGVERHRWARSLFIVMFCFMIVVETSSFYLQQTEMTDIFTRAKKWQRCIKQSSELSACVRQTSFDPSEGNNDLLKEQDTLIQYSKTHRALFFR